MSIQSVVAATIPITQTETPEIDVVNPGLNAILIPSFWTDAQISFDVLSHDGVTFIPFYYDGDEVTYTIASQQFRAIDPSIWLGVTKFRDLSGTHAVPVPQALPALIEFIGYFNTSPPTQGLVPSIRRIIYLNTVEEIQIFQPMTVGENDVCTFELATVLNSGEIIIQIVSFVLVPIGPLGTSDATPEARITGAETITGTQVSQRFGNFASEDAELVSNDGFIEYLVVATLATTQNNQLVVAGKLTVNDLPSVWVD